MSQGTDDPKKTEIVNLGQGEEDVNIPVSVKPPTPPEPTPQTDSEFWIREFPIKVVHWFVGVPRQPDFTEPASWRIWGRRRSGKSNACEAIAIRYMQKGGNIWDVCAAVDAESLSWVDSPWAKNVILIRGDETHIEPPPGAQYQIKPISEIDPLTAPEEQRIYILVKHFFANDDNYYDAMTKIFDRAMAKDSWHHVSAIIIREGETFLASQLRTHRARNSMEAAATLARTNSQLLHTSFSVIVDSVREMEISKSIREINSYTLLHALGSMSLNRKDWWVYRYLKPETIRNLKPYQSVIFTEGGSVGLCYIALVPFHHRRGSSILARLHLDKPVFDLEKVKQMERSQRKQLSSWVRAISPELHVDIVKLRESGATYESIAEQVGSNESTCRRSYNMHVRKLCGCDLSSTAPPASQSP